MTTHPTNEATIQQLHRSIPDELGALGEREGGKNITQDWHGSALLTLENVKNER
ncbi:hypothetical protein [Streptomyces pseudovenezuelae]|uniref:Uncharacterized protein n=1 Tax=Streptomyces pseudovenezuelae TaxID=67350 RepID=A0ABT6M122_9ACTN|nr:hypothetical protein [Streptomyces pseudovenezuelae]MDH6222264.1 hypothetical protein [Streptomyces pseudovenezuelae]